MAEVIEQIEALSRAARAELDAVVKPDELEQFRIKYLGTKGRLKELMTLLGQVPREQKPAMGQRVNAVKNELTARYEERKAGLGAGRDEGPMEDVTEPGKKPHIGNRHILIKVVDELTELFARLGFSVTEGPELEDDFHNFVALNIPESHPARDPLDNFYIDTDRPRSGSARLLRTQTSTVQIRVMKRQTPPIRVVIPGRVYRPDTIDQTHLPMFHQLEALVVDEGVTMVDLKSTVMQFIRAYVGPETKVRFRPSFFPFTEPSAEVDVWFEDKQKWIELGGCGMVHPNVFRSVGIDADRYTGWAFGFGIERIAMRKYAVDDIRHFVENDVRFLRQF